MTQINKLPDNSYLNYYGDALRPGLSVPTPHSALLIEAALHSGVSTAIPIAGLV
nr:hypothetical protein [uncultured Mucilaginibacter sp.]